MSSTGNPRLGRSSFAVAITGVGVAFCLFAYASVAVPDNMIFLMRVALGIAVLSAACGLFLGIAAGPRGAGRAGTLLSVVFLGLIGLASMFLTLGATSGDDPAGATAPASN